MIPFGVIGHVDVGKSTIAGHILKKVNYFDNETITKTERQCLKENKPDKIYSRLLDIYEDEQRRDKTFEFSSYNFKYDNKDYVLIDTPGHKEFIRSMIQGISYYNMNVFVCVISIYKNEFEASFDKQGQCKEDILICRAIGIKNIVIAINKIDAVDGDLDKRINEIKSKMQPFLDKLNFNNIEYVNVSGINGDGLDDLLKTINKYGQIKTKKKTLYERVNKSLGEFYLFKTILISSGFRAIAHINGNEYNIEFSVKNFIKEANNKYQICITFLDNDKPNLYKKQTLLIRNANDTIGLFIVKKISLK